MSCHLVKWSRCCVVLALAVAQRAQGRGRHVPTTVGGRLVVSDLAPLTADSWQPRALRLGYACLARAFAAGGLMTPRRPVMDYGQALHDAGATILHQKQLPIPPLSAPALAAYIAQP